jgi:hypothetical protein
MKSHPYAKTTGGGVSLPPESPASPVTLSPCTHIDRRGNHCRLFSADPESPLCPHHARLHRKQQRRENDEAAAELLGDLNDFSTADSINTLLSNLVRQLARKRIARRDAVALAYMAQLLLNSLPFIDRQFAAESREDDIPPRLIFDSATFPSDASNSAPVPISDSTKLAVPPNPAPFATPQTNEGRA